MKCSQQGKQNRPAKHPAIAAQERSRRPPLTRAALALAVFTTGGLMLAPLSPAGARTTEVMIVPDRYRTIQDAVDAAAPGGVVLVKPGIYRESVTVTTSDITIRGVDRFRTVLHGGDKIPNGITVSQTKGVTVENLTVRNYTSNGVYFTDSFDYSMRSIDAIKNRVYGLYVFASQDGEIRNSFAWGSGDAGFYIGECLPCNATVGNVHAEWNLIGYSGTNATGVTIRDSTWIHNAVGIMPNSLPFEQLGPNQGGIIARNRVIENNNEKILPASIWEIYGVPTGTGVWLLGVQNNIVKDNFIEGQKRYGVLISQTTDVHLPLFDQVTGNTIRDSAIYDIAWDGTGGANCFSDNKMNGTTGPPLLEVVYSCANPPLPGVLYPPVHADVLISLLTGSTREGREAPEPERPRCQKGRPGCS